VQSTIWELASIPDKKVVSIFFNNTMQKLLKFTQEATKPENSRNSNSRQIDHASNESSPSLLRYSFFFSLSYYMLLHVVRVAQSARDHAS
jgi:ribosomal RNA-processing protein 12